MSFICRIRALKVKTNDAFKGIFSYAHLAQNCSGYLEVSMSSIFFLPWVRTINPQEFGRIHFLPYGRGSEPGNLGEITQATLDKIIGNYADHANYPASDLGVSVKQATIVHWIDDDANLNITEEEISRRMLFAEWLTMSALSARRFGSHSHYCNSDGVTLIGQSFEPENAGAVLFSTRRRDGNSNIMLSADRTRPYFLRPIHVASSLVVEFDFQLLAALTQIKDLDLKNRIFDSVELFNQANTDASEVSQAAEMVMMRAAFETLLDASHKTADLVKEFTNHFSADLSLPVWHGGTFDENTWRTRWTNGSSIKRPLDAWVNDFCNARNDSAHGSSSASKYPPSVWSIHNHLMFTSWLFPLMVKGVLAKHGEYVLSDADRDCRADFEKFFSEDISARTTETPQESFWMKILSEIEAPEFCRVLSKLDGS